ncbi:hypothetical protein SLS60_005772 [Paraconiothyrium brasiliense]|uniref:Uncharacterized protein n=1 Tax=Paraconiothyrium brasiliense TaxID=300254 RepID=A0ABR3RD60_9PLEO
MIRLAAQVLTNAYSVTKLHLQDDMSPIGNKLRNKAFKRARYILDRQQFLLPHPYGLNGIADQDLYTAVRELNWIRSYRIEKFPESVSQDEIHLARRFHSWMRKRFYRYAQTTTTARRERTERRAVEKMRAKNLKIIEASLIPATALGTRGAGGGGGGQRGRVEMRPEPDAPALAMAFADFQREQALPQRPLLGPKTTHTARFDIDQVFTRKADIDTSQKRNVSPGRSQKIRKAMSTADTIVNAEGTTPTSAKSTREASTAQEVRPKRMAQEQGSKQRILLDHPDRRQISRGRKSRLKGAQSIGLPGDIRPEVK